MSNLSSVAATYRNKRMSITIGDGDGPRVSGIATEGHNRHMSTTLNAEDPAVFGMATERGGKRSNITLGIGPGSRVQNAETANRLSVPRVIKLSGAIEGQGVFDGSDDLTIYITGDYGKLTGKPEINGVVLDGDKTPTELNLQPAGEYADAPIDHSEIDDIINGNAHASDENNDDETMSTEDIDHIIG